MSTNINSRRSIKDECRKASMISSKLTKSKKRHKRKDLQYYTQRKKGGLRSKKLLMIQKSPDMLQHYDSMHIDSNQDFRDIKQLLRNQKDFDSLINSKDKLRSSRLILSREVSPINSSLKRERLRLKKFYFKKYVFGKGNNPPAPKKGLVYYYKHKSKPRINRGSSVSTFKRVMDPVKGESKAERGTSRQLILRELTTSNKTLEGRSSAIYGGKRVLDKIAQNLSTSKRVQDGPRDNFRKNSLNRLNPKRRAAMTRSAKLRHQRASSKRNLDFHPQVRPRKHRNQIPTPQVNSIDDLKEPSSQIMINKYLKKRKHKKQKSEIPKKNSMPSKVQNVQDISKITISPCSGQNIESDGDQVTMPKKKRGRKTDTSRNALELFFEEVTSKVEGLDERANLRKGDISPKDFSSKAHSNHNRHKRIHSKITDTSGMDRSIRKKKSLPATQYSHYQKSSNLHDDEGTQIRRVNSQTQQQQTTKPKKHIKKRTKSIKVPNNQKLEVNLDQPEPKTDFYPHYPSHNYHGLGYGQEESPKEPQRYNSKGYKDHRSTSQQIFSRMATSGIENGSPSFRVCDLFDRIHEEFESDDVRDLKTQIKRNFEKYRKPPETTLKNYKILKLLGKGSFGKVYLGLQILTNRLVAIKCLEKTSIKENSAKEKIKQEVDILKDIMGIKGASKLLEVFENRKYVFFVMMYAKDGDLLRYLKKHQKLTEYESRRIFTKILASLDCIHSRKILHRDIKLDNILLHEDMAPIICDFGVSRRMLPDEIINEQCGTPAYIAPEIIREKGYGGFMADFWSLGVLLYAMVTGKMPFKAETLDELHDIIMIGNFDFPPQSELSPEIRDLISKMLEVDPLKRLGAADIYRHPWLQLAQDQVHHLEDQTKDLRVKIDDEIVQQVSKYGFSEEYVRESVLKRRFCHACACYYNIERDFCQVY